MSCLARFSMGRTGHCWARICHRVGLCCLGDAERWKPTRSNAILPALASFTVTLAKLTITLGQKERRRYRNTSIRRGRRNSSRPSAARERNAYAATTSATRFRALALPTAAHDSAVQFTLLAASGMIGNQRLEHSGEPRGKSFRSDTLGGNAGALAQQEHFVG